MQDQRLGYNLPVFMTTKQQTPDGHIVDTVPDRLETAEMQRTARAAGIIAFGNITSRVLGLVRDTVKSSFFGATGLVSAFDLATKVPMMFFDLLVGGMVSSALVPVFSEYSKPENRDELWRVASFLLSIGVIALTLLTLIGEIFAPQIAYIIGGGLNEETLQLTTQLLRITLPAIVFLNVAGILSALLYALKRFTLPAFNSAIFNLGIVIATFAFARSMGIHAMAIGLLSGAILQVILQLPGLRDAKLIPVFDWRHPALRNIARLYWPILLGLIVDIVSRTLSYRLATETGDQSVAWMGYATTLMQFPLGLTSTAVAVAILPTLSQQAADSVTTKNNTAFLSTLAQGIRLVLVLIIPATFGMFLLANPIIKLIFEHGNFTPESTLWTTIVLRYYLIGVIAAAVDLLFVNAFYARQQAWTPALVGLVGVFVYLIVAFGPSFYRGMQLTDLMIANAVQLTFHTIVMWVLLHREVGSLRGHHLTSTTAKAVGASMVMVVVAWLTWQAVLQLPITGFLSEALQVMVPGATGALAYFFLANFLKISEVNQIVEIVQRKLKR